MQITEIKDFKDSLTKEEYINIYEKFNSLLTELKKIEISDKVVDVIHTEIEKINMINDVPKKMIKQVVKAQSNILNILEKDMHLVIENHYRNLWLSIGVGFFGLPLGVIYGLAIGNMAFSPLGLPIGLGIGIAIGSKKDKDAEREGRVIKF